MLDAGDEIGIPPGEFGVRHQIQVGCAVQDFFGSGYVAATDGRMVVAKGFLEAIRRRQNAKSEDDEPMAMMGMYGGSRRAARYPLWRFVPYS